MRVVYKLKQRTQGGVGKVGGRGVVAGRAIHN